MIPMLGQPWLTGSIDILAGQCGFGKGFIRRFGENLLTLRRVTLRRAADSRRAYTSSRIVTLVMATGAFGRSRELRGAVAMVSTTSRPFVTWPKIV
jgi:hypothetical protein